MVFVARVIRHELCMMYAFFGVFFVQKSFLTKNYFHTAGINWTIWGPLYTCLIIAESKANDFKERKKHIFTPTNSMHLIQTSCWLE